jgi:hypothetical protein
VEELSASQEGSDGRYLQRGLLQVIEGGSQEVQVTLPPMKTPTVEAPYAPEEGHEFELPPKKFADSDHSPRIEACGVPQLWVEEEALIASLVDRLGR